MLSNSQTRAATDVPFELLLPLPSASLPAGTLPAGPCMSSQKLEAPVACMLPFGLECGG